MANKFRQGDEVIVLTGKDKGKRGTITKVHTDTARVVVENVKRALSEGTPVDDYTSLLVE